MEFGQVVVMDRSYRVQVIWRVPQSENRCRRRCYGVLAGECYGVWDPHVGSSGKKGSVAKATCRDNLCPPATDCKEMLRTVIKDSGLMGVMDMYNIPMLSVWGILWKKEAEARVPYESSLWSPVSFPIDFGCGKLAGKATKADHVTVGYSNHYNFEPVANLPTCNHVTIRTLQQLQLRALVINSPHSAPL